MTQTGMGVPSARIRPTLACQNVFAEDLTGKPRKGRSHAYPTQIER